MDDTYCLGFGGFLLSCVSCFISLCARLDKSCPCYQLCPAFLSIAAFELGVGMGLTGMEIPLDGMGKHGYRVSQRKA